jgi:hypothetical protein
MVDTVMSNIDVVVPYVNPNDSFWVSEYNKYKCESDEKYKRERFRDTSFLKYVLLSIEKYMTFANKIHLVVAYESQIPEYVDKNKVNVVLHKDFIPEEFLPTFNCNTIEMFLHKIPNLAENFIYFNDDIIVNKECNREDFFEGDKCNVVAKLQTKDVGDNTWFNCLYNDTRIINKVLNIEDDNKSWYIFPHTATALNKTLCEELFNKIDKEIYSKITRFRDKINFNQHLYALYILSRGFSSYKPITVKYVNINKYEDDLWGNIDALTVCLNDLVKESDEVVNEKHKIIENYLEKRFT